MDGLVVVPTELDLGVLRIFDEIRTTDKVSCSRKKFGEIRVLSDALARCISAGEMHVDSRGRHFKEYSAVSPNEKKDDSGFTSYWYMLPGLTKRHLPDLCVTRINTNTAECIFVPQTPEAPVAVDANFSTLWCCSEQTTKIAFALLNSSWSKCYLEIISAIMGGGALKVEASHMLCRNFALETERPDVSRVGQAFDGMEVQDRRSVLDSLQKMFRKLQNDIQWEISPQERKQPEPSRPVR